LLFLIQSVDFVYCDRLPARGVDSIFQQASPSIVSSPCGE
jgi:hypothetical protein